MKKIKTVDDMVEHIDNAPDEIRGQKVSDIDLIRMHQVSDKISKSWAEEPGMKYDQEKPRCGLVVKDFSKAIQSISDIGTYGAAKYAPSNWLKVDPERYADAFMRHYLSHLEGEELDPESGYPHLAHATWNMLAILELYERNKN